MSALDNFWRSLGFDPHPSNLTHLFAGIPIGLLFFLMPYFHFKLDYWLSFLIAFAAGFIIGAIKEWSDATRKEVRHRKWDWLDLIYTVMGSIITPVIVGLAVIIL